MVHFIEETAHWKEYVSGNAKNPILLQEALKQAFLDIDAALRTYQWTINKQDQSGCTSVTAMITPNFIICANAGDSRCVMGTNGKAKAMSEDHKPNNELEQRRIESAGGRVQWKRVDGDLAVSRGLGDFQYKTRSDLAPTEQKVSLQHFIFTANCTIALRYEKNSLRYHVNLNLSSIHDAPRTRSYCWHVTAYGTSWIMMRRSGRYSKFLRMEEAL